MSATEPTVAQMLAAMTERYAQKAHAEVPLFVQLEIGPEPQTWHVIAEAEQEVKLAQGPHPQAPVILTLSEETLRCLYTGELAPLTAAGRAHISEPAPLDFRLGAGQSFNPELYARMITFIQRFFNRFEPERILLGEEHARVIHGGHAVALFYDTGFRSAWYLLKPGERLNAPGDTNPFPQGFVLISGGGHARLGGQEIEVQAGKAYYVPPETEHIVWNDREEPLVIIWLAWGAGA